MHPQLAVSLPPLPRATRRSRPTGLVPGTLVQTEDGPMPVEYLLAGDRIVTRTGLAELRGTSVLAAVETEVVVIDPAAQQPGHGGAALVVPAAQPVLVRDWRATILHGSDEMLTPAASLVDGVLVRRESRDALRLIRLHFDTPQVFWAGGMQLGSARTRAPAVPPGRWLH